MSGYNYRISSYSIEYLDLLTYIYPVAEKTHASKTKKGTEGTVCNSAIEIFVTF